MGIYLSILKSVVRIGIVAALCLGLACCADKKQKQSIGQKVFDFPANLNQAKIKTSTGPYTDFALNSLARDQSARVKSIDPDYVNFRQEFTINNDRRKVLYEHPFAEVRFEDVAVPENALLHFGIAMHPDAWSKRGDGVLFEVSIVNESGGKTMIFAEYIDPKKKPEDRKWFDYDLDLQAYSGKKVTFIFATDAGPRNDSRDDWAGWSDLQIALKATTP